MSKHPAPTLFHWLRRATALRVLLVVATLLASQESLGCTVEQLVEQPGIVSVAEPAEVPPTVDPDCCASCPDCTRCGACHSSPLSMRAPHEQLVFHTGGDAAATAAAVASPRWKPPSLLRPPIHLA